MSVRSWLGAPVLCRVGRVALATLCLSPLVSSTGAAHAAGVNQYAFPSWLPLRHNHDGGSFKVSCVKSNCDNGTYHGYWAIDFSDPTGKPGAPVYAAGSGQVVAKDGSHSDCGGQGTPANYVNIDHGSGVVSRYLHLSTVSVTVGEWVDQNTQVGSVGSVGWTDPVLPITFTFRSTSTAPLPTPER